ncbi:restriction endonuclease subunit S [Runella sp. SP2]|uniref:restriction endonuclease subunit S n=1 Tax=Runella sp. SP2 TaxID=2268026 RepID=UPI000F076C49|nr:restriction endonuclease subunit S [Runella sp. SP2]AYQ32933.1 restriction endonuclease [Runella sp. SP2]
MEIETIKNNSGVKWKMVKLGEVVDIKNGRDHKKVNNVNGQYPIIGSGGIMGYADDFLCEGNATIIGRKGSINNPIYIESRFWNVDTAFALCPKKEIEPKFFYYFCTTYNFAKHNKATTLPSLTKTDLLEIQIPLPPLPVQKRIAEILDAADALRRKDQELLKKYDELAQAIFIDMFGDPVKNEKGWEVKLFGELFDTRLGKMLDAKKQVGNTKYKYLGNSNVQWFRFQLEDLAEMEFEEKDLSTFELKDGDILICEGGEVGRSAIWRGEKEDIYFQKAIHRARAKSQNITSEYTVMLFWFYAKFGGLKDFVTTSTISHLTGEKLKTIPIPVPPISLQVKFDNLILGQKKLVGQRSSNLSSSLFQTLLQKAFKGELVAE